MLTNVQSKLLAKVLSCYCEPFFLFLLIVNIVYTALKDDSELLKHELAYCLGQIGNPKANTILSEVLEDLNEHEMVRHEVQRYSS